LTFPKSRKDPQISLGPVGATPDKYVDPASTAACAKSFNWRVDGAFATAVILHVLWNTFASIRSATFVGSVSIEFVSLLIALVSLTLLIRRVREARRAAEMVGDAGGGVT
jgi:hypothetical protein